MFFYNAPLLISSSILASIFSIRRTATMSAPALAAFEKLPVAVIAPRPPYLVFLDFVPPSWKRKIKPLSRGPYDIRCAVDALRKRRLPPTWCGFSSNLRGGTYLDLTLPAFLGSYIPMRPTIFPFRLLTLPREIETCAPRGSLGISVPSLSMTIRRYSASASFMYCTIAAYSDFSPPTRLALPPCMCTMSRCICSLYWVMPCRSNVTSIFECFYKYSKSAFLGYFTRFCLAGFSLRLSFLRVAQRLS